MLGVNVRKMKAPIFKIEMVTLIGKGTHNLACFVYQVYEINSKIFLLRRYFIFGGLPQIWINTFSLSRHVLFIGGGGHLRLETSCIQINMVFKDVILMDLIMTVN